MQRNINPTSRNKIDRGHDTLKNKRWNIRRKNKTNRYKINRIPSRKNHNDQHTKSNTIPTK